MCIVAQILQGTPRFALDDDVLHVLESGDLGSDANDEVHDKLEALVSNLNVDIRKIVMPDSDSPLVGHAADALTLVVMVRSFFDQALFELICHKVSMCVCVCDRVPCPNERDASKFVFVR